MNASRPQGLQVSLVDLTEAMRKLRAAAGLSGTGVGSVTDTRGAALAVLSSSGAFLSVNRSAAALLGYATTDLVGRLLVDMAPEDAQATLAAELGVSAQREFHSFGTVLSERSGIPTQFVLHQQSVLASDRTDKALLTLFEEPSVLAPGAVDGPQHADSHQQDCLRYLTLGQQKERQRLASELHDGLGQALTLVKLMAEQALMRMRRGQVEDAAQLLGETVLRIRESIGDVRQICGELRPPMLDRLGLPAALESLCRRTERGAENISVTFDCDVGDEDVPEHLKNDIFRVAQEALNNTVKHAFATTIELGLRHVGSSLALTIKDNGVGYENHLLSTENDYSTSLGLVGMQHRVESHGGTFSIRSPGAGGTLVSAEWPV
jgi:two-component system NarL family sensor kinase